MKYYSINHHSPETPILLGVLSATSVKVNGREFPTSKELITFLDTHPVTVQNEYEEQCSATEFINKLHTTTPEQRAFAYNITRPVFEAHKYTLDDDGFTIAHNL